MALGIIKADPYLAPYEQALNERVALYKAKRDELVGDSGTLTDFANGYEYFGIHKTAQGWVYREWAPAADKMYFTGDFAEWDCFRHEMTRLENGVFEICLEGENTLSVGQKVQCIILRGNELLRRVPSYATRVVQDEKTYSFCAEVDDLLFDNFEWTDQGFKPQKTPFIYECHIGMAQEEGKVSSFDEFTETVLPRIKRLGYNTIQIMAIMEHPYYGSFGYQVSSFFAVSSRYGKASGLKRLVNKAHEMGISVLLDVVHSHAVKNGGDGLNYFDGTTYQYFHEGERGYHPAWDTMLFNYDKNEVIHFLLSNLKYWMQIFHFDGFRFDGVTSMLYRDHGLGRAFTDYSAYFTENTDTEAVTYLMLANELVHELDKNAVTVAEDMSGMPGMCLPIKQGGIGFDYRLSMGIPDLWIKMIKEYKDDDWDMFKL
ncbi:MAG: 1,4-alpha-glucan-branching enzyme, partial [Clostridia bacterium]|nr:1,4-alpha-glucan-branching enzyme [Clostridia bacterium]